VTLVGIVAKSNDGCISIGGEIPWKCKEDLRYFKNTTIGFPIVMGRRTWESIGGKPLPDRKNIVLSRFNNEFPGATRMSFKKALEYCKDKKVFIIGGLNIYKLFIPYINEFHVTTINKVIGMYPYGLNLPKDFFDGFKEIRKTVLSDMATVRVLQRV